MKNNPETPAVPPRRRGAPLRSEPGAAERILATATDLFYREGIRATGVDTVVARTGISKTSLYRCFPSKDDLIVAVLEAMNARFWAWWDATVAPYKGKPDKQLNAVLKGIVRRSCQPEFRGCPFLNVSTEYRDLDHPARVVARQNKRELQTRLEQLCREMGVTKPNDAAIELVLLLNGTDASGLIFAAPDLERRLLSVAQAILAKNTSKRRQR